MERRRFIVNERGEKTAVVLPIAEYESPLEDLDDLATIAERREEPSEALEAVLARVGTR